MTLCRSLIAALLLIAAAASTPAAANSPDVRSAAMVPGEPIIIRPGPTQTVQQEETTEWQPWQAALAKTLSYRSLSAVDAAATVAFFGWAAAGNISVTGLAALSGLYFLHDWAWTAFGPPAEDRPVESAAIRFVSYRLVSGVFSAVTGIGRGGDFQLAQATALGDVLLEGTVYFFHDLAWTLWGPPIERTF